MQNMIGTNSDPETISQNFIKFQPRFVRYHCYFALCEFLNIATVLSSFFIIDQFLLNKFLGYGQEVFRYIWAEKTLNPDNGRFTTHDPMCELFPTEVSLRKQIFVFQISNICLFFQVSCILAVGATTGAIDRTHYLCILNNNLFNQKFFMALWCWFVILLGLSMIGLIYRCSRMFVPDFSRLISNCKNIN